MSKHRNAELNALLFSVKNNVFNERGITLITYKDLIKRIGFENMKAPDESTY
jgi:hypothetical protein